MLPPMSPRLIASAVVVRAVVVRVEFSIGGADGEGKGGVDGGIPEEAKDGGGNNGESAGRTGVEGVGGEGGGFRIAQLLSSTVAAES